MSCSINLTLMYYQTKKIKIVFHITRVDIEEWNKRFGWMILRFFFSYNL